MTFGPMATDRERHEVEALVADRYLEGLLAAAGHGADDSPVPADLDPELRRAAQVLHRVLLRVHPSFRFEERLAARLAAFVPALPAPMPAATAGTLLPFRSPATSQRALAGRADEAARAGGAPRFADPLLEAILAGDLDPADADAVARAERRPLDRRPLLVGGAITSAALSLVGVAWVAWRASRPSWPVSDGPVDGPGMTGRASRTAPARRATARSADVGRSA